MIRYIFGRILRGVLILLGVVLVAFTLVLLTGDPAAAMMGPDASQAEIAQVRAEMGFNDPIPIQYARYVGRMLQGDFGRSHTFRQAALPLILDRLPATLILAAA